LGVDFYLWSGRVRPAWVTERWLGAGSIWGGRRRCRETGRRDGRLALGLVKMWGVGFDFATAPRKLHGLRLVALPAGLGANCAVLVSRWGGSDRPLLRNVCWGGLDCGVSGASGQRTGEARHREGRLAGRSALAAAGTMSDIAPGFGRHPPETLGLPKLSARESRMPSRTIAMLFEVPSAVWAGDTHGVGSRSRTGTGRGPQPLATFAAPAALQHR
jgi:hypothetical protein